LRNREQLLLIGGRRDAFENPLLPSRLLFNANPPQDAKRLLQIIHHSESQATLDHSKRVPENQQFEIPKLPPLTGPLVMSVTDFDYYLTCPYRYYLSRVLRLRSIDDRIEEMDPATFGSIAHEALDRFGKSDLKDSADAKQIRAFLRDELQTQYNKLFDRHPLPAIQIQKAQLEMRLDRFAEVQALHRRNGWLIWETEIPGVEKAFVVDGSALTVKGRIDRIDRNERTSRQAIIDYKTSKRHSTKSQIGREGWKSLQLPLYHWLISGAEIDNGTTIEVGFGRLCQTIDEIEIDLKEWEPADLAVAMEQASEIVRAIRANNFVPNPKPPYSDEFDGICQNRVFEKWTSSEREAVE